ncbi:MAG: hypothetical protein WHV28_07300 [Bacteroidota bacterium]
MDISSIKPQGVSGPKDNERVSDKKSKAKTSSGKTSASSGGDTLSISTEAQKLSRIFPRISSGYYNSPEVLKETAQRILNELDKQE